MSSTKKCQTCARELAVPKSGKLPPHYGVAKDGVHLVFWCKGGSK